MSRHRILLTMAACGLLSLLGACNTVQPYDYSNYHAHPPRSILILPPLNQTTHVEGTYGYLSTVTYPVAELGYYVYPVAVVDQLFKENGMPTAGEMQQAPLDKVREITGADAVLYISLEEYGTTYKVLDSPTTVKAHAKLIDTRTQTLLWEGEGIATQSASGGSGNLLATLIASAVAQVVNTTSDRAHKTSRAANANLFLAKDRGLPYGPYNPKYPSTP
jgi:hypothetical protein